MFKNKNPLVYTSLGILTALTLGIACKKNKKHLVSTPVDARSRASLASFNLSEQNMQDFASFVSRNPNVIVNYVDYGLKDTLLNLEPKFFVVRDTLTEQETKYTFYSNGTQKVLYDEGQLTVESSKNDKKLEANYFSNEQSKADFLNEFPSFTKSSDNIEIQDSKRSLIAIYSNINSQENTNACGVTASSLPKEISMPGNIFLKPIFIINAYKLQANISDKTMRKHFASIADGFSTLSFYNEVGFVFYIRISGGVKYISDSYSQLNHFREVHNLSTMLNPPTGTNLFMLVSNKVWGNLAGAMSPFMPAHFITSDANSSTHELGHIFWAEHSSSTKDVMYYSGGPNKFTDSKSISSIRASFNYWINKETVKILDITEGSAVFSILKSDAYGDIYIGNSKPGYGLSMSSNQYELADKNGKIYRFTSRDAFGQLTKLSLQDNLLYAKKNGQIIYGSAANLVDVFSITRGSNATYKIQIDKNNKDQVYITNTLPGFGLGWGSSIFKIYDNDNKAYTFSEKDAFGAETILPLNGVKAIAENNDVIYGTVAEEFIQSIRLGKIYKKPNGSFILKNTKNTIIATSDYIAPIETKLEEQPLENLLVVKEGQSWCVRKISKDGQKLVPPGFYTDADFASIPNNESRYNKCFSRKPYLVYFPYKRDGGSYFIAIGDKAGGNLQDMIEITLVEKGQWNLEYIFAKKGWAFNSWKSLTVDSTLFITWGSKKNNIAVGSTVFLTPEPFQDYSGSQLYGLTSNEFYIKLHTNDSNVGDIFVSTNTGYRFDTETK